MDLSVLEGRRVVLGVSGGIAAYKAVEVCRLMVGAGAHVVPVMTADAHRFIGEVTLSALASEPVHTSLWDDASPIPHTRLGQDAEVIVVAPATARILSAYATGSSEDLLTATLIATRAPVVVCPAMHTEMWEHPAVQDNIALLRARGVTVVDPQSGRLAGGDLGAGRLADPATVLAAVCAVLARGRDLIGLSVVVTAGGTREPIDAVRMIANRSSGRQGHAIADAASRRGATVTVITTSDLATPPGATVLHVETAQQMHDATLEAAETADVVVMTAAVADFRPVCASAGKIKKRDGIPEIVLEKTPDILLALGERKRPGQTIVGFAAETDDLVANARQKLEQKHVDLVVANDVSAPGVGFGHTTNAVTILGADGTCSEVPLADKGLIAGAVLDSVMRFRTGRETQ